MIQIDRRTVQQVLGDLMLKPSLLDDTDKYKLETSDFPQQLDKYIFAAVYNLHLGGAEKIHIVDIENYFKENSVAANLIKRENGFAFLQDCETFAEPDNFPFYYTKLKKLNLIREMEKDGYSIDKYYSNNPLDEDYEKINQKFEELSAKEIVDGIKLQIANYESKYCLDKNVEESNPYDDIEEVINELAKTPDTGVPLQGDIFNTVCRGGRLGTLYLLSAGSSVGKSRTMVAHACKIAYPIRYDEFKGKWVYTGHCEKCLYVMTEQDPAEIQTMIMAYLTGINESNFVYGTFNTKEYQTRIKVALRIMQEYGDNLYFARIPDPNASVVKNLFTRYHLEKKVNIFFYDYIFSSPAMLNEYRDLKVREDVSLRLFTTELKKLSVELNSFIFTATQVSQQDVSKTDSWLDQNNIQASRAIVNTADFAFTMTRPTEEELKKLQSCGALIKKPNRVFNIYKNRRGQYTICRIWTYFDLGTCRMENLLITDTLLNPLQNYTTMIPQNTEEDKKEKESVEKIYNTYSEMIENREDIRKLPTGKQFVYANDKEIVENGFNFEEDIDKTFKTEEHKKNDFKDKSIGDLL